MVELSNNIRIGDKYGRKKTFIITILWYSVCTIITALSPNFYMFLIFRALTSVGVAGEYSSVTASIAEFVPSKHRGKLSVLIQGLSDSLIQEHGG